MDKEYNLEFSDKGVYMQSVRRDFSENPGSVLHNNKEVFVRKVFEDDPQKGCELLFKWYYQPLCSHAVRFVYSKQIAEDIISDIFYTLLEKQVYRHITRSYRAYLFAAARNRSLKHLQREFGKGNSLDLDSLPSPSGPPSPQETLLYDELLRKIELTIQHLTPRNQEVFLMNRFEGKKYDQIARELSISVKAVEAHITKALGLLRSAVRHQVTKKRGRDQPQHVETI